MGILLIAASPVVPSRSAALLAAAGLELEAAGMEPHTLNLRELPAEALLGQAEHPAVRTAVRQVADAHAIVIATPIYKAAYSGLLKVFLDLLPPEALRRKAVLPMATGGSTAHLLALDYALQPVLGMLGARDILDAVYAAEAQISPRQGGGYEIDDDIQRRVRRGVAALVARIPILRAGDGGTRAVPAPAEAARCSA